ncbi:MULTISPECIES: DUF4924 family protein [Sanguibacteroides]|uniref:Uncharacterized protein n=2 Tax=Porphyromonadaceae TaxID=171551 RepID=A0A0C3MEI1_9PORP|nr:MULTISPECIES: DUF4924 family protein [Sanguibacteroides]KIO43133.1 hypothetical protein IE90_13055 [Sanguibacteroides justesenii]KIO44848.1 hypothetical protein BA92_07450 [Sanguibacteroides justesenii]PXZ43059.1 DUF4924 family protein [Sanguibacteroides justesenii]
MLIAREKRKSNLAEYILYMWQLEDMLRALHLDMTLVDQHIVSGFQVDESTRKEMLDWYDNLVEMMKKEEVTREGHLQVIKNMVSELTEMHYHLLHQTHDVRYRHIFMAAANNLLDYRRKSDLSEEVSDVELALHALYGNLLLKLQKKEIHAQTTAAMESFSRMLAYLSAVYKRMEEENE